MNIIDRQDALVIRINNSRLPDGEGSNANGVPFGTGSFVAFRQGLHRLLMPVGVPVGLKSSDALSASLF